MKSESINPLLIPRILHETLNFLTILDLKSTRLVNQQWNQEATKLLRIKNRILFNFNSDEISTFMRLHYPLSWNCFPYSKLILGSELLKKVTWEDVPFQTFFATFGHLITRVHLSVCLSRNEDASILKHLLENGLPNLESLSVLFNQGNPKVNFNIFDGKEEVLFVKLKKLSLGNVGYDRNFVTPFFLEYVLKRSPYLETISPIILIPEKTVVWSNYGNDFVDRMSSEIVSFNSCFDPAKSVTEALLQPIHRDPDNFYLRHLKNVEILVRFNDTQLESFISNNFVLETLYIELDKTVMPENLQKLFINLKNSIKEMCIELPCYSQLSSNSLLLKPPMLLVNLGKIALVNYEGSLSFLKMCPQIVEAVFFNLNVKSCPDFDVKDASKWTCKSLNQFQMRRTKPTGLYEIVPLVLARRFPGLTSLYLDNVNNAVVKSVFANLIRLKCLTLIGDGLTDGGICGETDKIIRILMESVIHMKDPSLEERSWDFQPRFSNITDLKDLQVLSIESSHISDASLILGVIKCKLLKKLNLVSHLELITDLGYNYVNNLENLEELRMLVRNKGFVSLHGR